MEPFDAEGLRLRLVLGKYRVTERTSVHFKVALGGSTTMTVPLMEGMDVREGDILTLYTEVPYARPKSTPVQ